MTPLAAVKEAGMLPSRLYNPPLMLAELKEALITSAKLVVKDKAAEVPKVALEREGMSTLEELIIGKELESKEDNSGTPAELDALAKALPAKLNAEGAELNKGALIGAKILKGSELKEALNGAKEADKVSDNAKEAPDNKPEESPWLKLLDKALCKLRLLCKEDAKALLVKEDKCKEAKLLPKVALLKAGIDKIVLLLLVNKDFTAKDLALFSREDTREG